MRLLLSIITLCMTISPSVAEIRIATVGPMTGQYASIGEQMRRGAEMAVANINAQGGLLGRKLVLEVGDDVCDPRQATAIANQLINRNVVFVAGHFCSSASIPASNLYNDADVIMMTPASTAPALTERGLETIFRICGRDDQQGRVAAEFLAREHAGKNVAVVHDKTAYGKGLADVARDELIKRGMNVVLYDAITAGERDFSSLVTRMKRAKVGVIYIGGYHTETGLIRRQSLDQGLNAVIMAGDALVTQEYWTITGRMGEGTLLTFSPDPRLNPTAKPIVEAFRAINYEPEGYTLYNYAAIQVFAQAVRKAGSVEPEKLLAALHSNTFATVRGDIRFDIKGDVEGPSYVVYRWSDGQYSYAEDVIAEAAATEPPPSTTLP